MTERQQAILNAVIQEYSKTARPVGSSWLSSERDFGIKPAMIRQELATLEDEGYLMQPHTSAGRVPTDKAYRRFISREVLKQKPDTRPEEGQEADIPGLSQKEQEKIEHALRSAEDMHTLLRSLSRISAEIAHGLSVTGLADRRLFFATGLSELAQEPEMEDSEYMRTVMQLVDDIDTQFEKMWDRLFSEDVQVLVGQENPLESANRFSLVTREYQLNRPNSRKSEHAFISIIGPRRMDYKKNVALVEYICKLLQK